MLDAIKTAVLPEVLNTLALVLGLLLSWLLLEVKRRTGVDIRVQQNIEVDQLRARLEEVIVNGARAALADGMDKALPETFDWVADYVRTGAPDAVKKLGATRPLLGLRAKAVLQSLAGEH